MNRGMNMIIYTSLTHCNRKVNEKKQEIANEFLSKFQLTEAELNALKAPINRVRQIQSDCKSIVSQAG
jgi:hypothetical protein